MTVIELELHTCAPVHGNPPWLERGSAGQTRVRLTSPADERSAELLWAIYVELRTRMAAQDVATSDGRDRCLLSSLNRLFQSVREATVRAGPLAGRAAPATAPAAGVAGLLLEAVLRPFLERWHLSLAKWESSGNTCADRTWPEHEAFRRALAPVRADLEALATALEAVMAVDPLPRTAR